MLARPLHRQGAWDRRMVRRSPSSSDRQLALPCFVFRRGAPARKQLRRRAYIAYLPHSGDSSYSATLLVRFLLPDPSAAFTT
jgi:hypothetical protein